jgi:Glycosyltransferase family 87
MRMPPLKALAALLALGLGAATLHKAQGLGSPDFRVFYVAARHVLMDPENLYRVSPDRYLYPPGTAILLLPFAFSATFALHQWIWHGLLVLLLFLLASQGLAELCAMAVLTRYLLVTFMYGQINLPVLALMALSGSQLEKGASAGAGAFWALASGLKIYPAVLAPAFFRRDRWRAWLAAGLVGLTFALLPFLVFGPALGLGLYREFFEALRAKGLPLHSHNQSLAAFLLRIGTPEPFILHGVGLTSWGWLHLPSSVAHALAWLIGGAVAGFSWRTAWREGLGARVCLSAAAFSFLFLSHIVWKDYLLFLFFPLSELFTRWPKQRSFWLGGTLLGLLTLSSPDILGAELATRCDAASIHLWAAALVWGAWWKK